MRRQAVWIWGLAFLVLGGCQVADKQEVDKLDGKEKPSMVSAENIIILKVGTVTSKVMVLSSAPPVTLSLTEDTEDSSSYVAETEHDCSAKTSTLKYLAVFDEQRRLIVESEEETLLEVEPNSLGEAEQRLACSASISTPAPEQPTPEQPQRGRLDV